MNLEEIHLQILPDGSVQIEVKGIQGSTCLDLTHDLEQALGGVILSRDLSFDAHLPSPPESQPIQSAPIRQRKKKAG